MWSTAGWAVRRLFQKDDNDAGFERTVELALAAVPVRLHTGYAETAMEAKEQNRDCPVFFPRP